MRRAIALTASLFLTGVCLGQARSIEIPRPQTHQSLSLRDASPWREVSIGTDYEATVEEGHDYHPADMMIRAQGTVNKVSIERISDGTFIVYWPVNSVGTKRVAYMRIDASFDLLGKVVHTLLYGDPDEFLPAEQLEKVLKVR